MTMAPVSGEWPEAELKEPDRFSIEARAPSKECE